MAPVRIVPALQPLKDGHPRVGLASKASPVEPATQRAAKKLSAIALSYASPVDPIDGMTPGFTTALAERVAVWNATSRVTLYTKSGSLSLSVRNEFRP